MSNTNDRTQQQLAREVEELQIRLEEAEETLRAIREGEVDAIIVSGTQGEQVFSLVGADSVYRLIVETMKEAAFTLAFDGTILYCNAQFGDLLQYPLEQIVGRPFQEFVAPDQLSAAEAMLAEARRQPVRRRLVLQNAQGHWVPIHIGANLLNPPEGPDPSICAVAADLTALEQSTEVIQQRTDDLAHTVETLQEEVERRIRAEKVLRGQSAQLRAMASELTLAEQRERGRLAKILHDGLQQILVGANLHIEMLQRVDHPRVQSGAAAVRALIQEAIETSRSLTAELSPPILREGGLVAGLQWLVRWMEDKHRLHVDLDAPDAIPRLSDDTAILLFQTIRELLFNVVKHAGVSEARVEVAKEGEQVRVIVADRGQGFAFEGADASQETVGSGLGLLSIHERIGYMGGKVHVESVPGQGTRVMLAVPLAAAHALRPLSVLEAQATGVNAPYVPSVSGQIRVVLVDDHIVMRQGLVTLLEGEPDILVVGEAADGESAVRLVRETHPDVVLMDISMPGMNGIEATRILHAEMPGVCVIGLSMFEAEEQARAMRDAGAEAYLTKTGPSASLLAAIRNCVPGTKSGPARSV